MCLKALPKKGIQFITFLINSCLKNCYFFPNQFKEAKVLPIRKPNKPYDNPTSYRPISLLSSIKFGTNTRNRARPRTYSKLWSA